MELPTSPTVVRDGASHGDGTLAVMGTPFRRFRSSLFGLARRFGIDVDSVFDVRYRIVLQQRL